MRSRRAAALALVALALVAGGCAFPAPSAPPDPPTPAPRIVAVLGDSISRGTNAESPGEHLADSWATGANANVSSVAARLAALDGGRALAALHNDAEGGARMADLADQARLAVAQRANVVLVLIGANDACRANVTQMTSVDAFRAAFDEAARVLRDGLPHGATVLVLSIPDVHRVWEAEHENAVARALWRASGACRALLREDATDAEREQVRARIDAYDAVLVEESARFGFATDGGAVHGAPFDGAHLSRVDAFHPSVEGQRALAEVAWRASPWGPKA